MKTIEFKYKDVDVIVAQYLLPAIKTHRIFTFSGPLGAGKTTLIKSLLRQCGIREVVTSPTFTYVNTYTNAQNILFYHFDLYRIDSVDAFIQAGFDEYIQEKERYCFVEWPAVIAPLLQDKSLADAVCEIELHYCSDDQDRRIMRISAKKR